MAGCFSKFFLFVLNFAIFGVGIAIIVLSSLILSQTGDFNALLDSGTLTIPIIFLIFGLAVMILGFFGCFGALRESPCLLYTYAIIILALFIGQVALVIYGFVSEDDIRKYISGGMTETFEQYGKTDEETAALDKAQSSLQCCGTFNYTDWYEGVINSAIQTDVPMGCCREQSPGCNDNIRGVDVSDVAQRIYTVGCYSKLEQTIEGESLWLIIGGIILAIVQLACITIACGLGKNSRSATVY